MTKPEVGPIYGVPLLSSLPLDGSTMKQALPSRQDLDDVRRTKINGNDRVVAGYEVLLEHYRRACEEVERLRAVVERLPLTADGVPVVPPVKLWFVRQSGKVEPMDCDCIDWLCGEWLARNWKGNASPQPGCRALSKLFSTEAAAHAAQQTKGE